jgi:hypothetical protein
LIGRRSSKLRGIREKTAFLPDFDGHVDPRHGTDPLAEQAGHDELRTFVASCASSLAHEAPAHRRF